MELYKPFTFQRSDNKHGCHRKILFLIGWILITQSKSLVIIQLQTRCSYFIVWCCPKFCCCHLYANCYQMIMFVLVDQFFPNSTPWSMAQDYGWDLFMWSAKKIQILLLNIKHQLVLSDSSITDIVASNV